MTANERRAEIMRIMTARRQESMGRLALELGVTRRTIRSNITTLTVDYPLETQRGNGGCVKVADWYHPHRSIRKYTDEADVVQAATAAGYKDIYKKTLIGIGEMEKLMGKEQFRSILGQYVTKPHGKLTLVPESDRREAVTASTAQEDFGGKGFSPD